MLRVVAHGAQTLQAGQDLLLQGADFRFDVAGLARLPQGRIDLHQVVQGLQVAPQRQATAQQVEALQFNAGALKFAIGIAYQVEVGHQHWQQEQHTDQAELHAEAQAIHQCHGGIEQTLHKKSPFVFLIFIGRHAEEADSHYGALLLYSLNRQESL